MFPRRPVKMHTPEIARPRSRRGFGSAALRRTLLGSAAGLALTSPALSQEAPAGAPEELPTVSVQGATQGADGYKTDKPGIQKLTEPLLDTPQTISVITNKLISDQADTNLRDALRNVPGISIAAGEAGAQGDNITIRGFTARNDIYLDGMRDFGSYTATRSISKISRC